MEKQLRRGWFFGKKKSVYNNLPLGKFERHGTVGMNQKRACFFFPVAFNLEFITALISPRAIQMKELPSRSYKLWGGNTPYPHFKRPVTLCKAVYTPGDTCLLRKSPTERRGSFSQLTQRRMEAQRPDPLHAAHWHLLLSRQAQVCNRAARSATLWQPARADLRIIFGRLRISVRILPSHTHAYSGVSLRGACSPVPMRRCCSREPVLPNGVQPQARGLRTLIRVKGVDLQP